MTVLPTLWPVVGVIVATGVVTYALVQVWDRLIQRDEAEAERLLADHEESERLRRDEARRAGESKVILVKEVNHRTKNLLAVVTAILRLSRNDDPEAFMTGVLSRVNSLARTHTMLAENGWDDTHLSKLVDGELAQFLRPTSSERI
ncbi:MAG: HWE histidine kinase domain-containing protein, partial [Alphaproteobacteria bacterium]